MENLIGALILFGIMAGPTIVGIIFSYIKFRITGEV